MSIGRFAFALVFALGLAGCHTCPGIAVEEDATRGHVTGIDLHGNTFTTDVSGDSADLDPDTVTIHTNAYGDQLDLDFFPAGVEVFIRLHGITDATAYPLTALEAIGCVCDGASYGGCNTFIDPSDTSARCEPLLGAIEVSELEEVCDESDEQRGCLETLVADLSILGPPGAPLSGTIHVERRARYDADQICGVHWPNGL